MSEWLVVVKKTGAIVGALALCSYETACEWISEKDPRGACELVRKVEARGEEVDSAMSDARILSGLLSGGESVAESF